MIRILWLLTFAIILLLVSIGILFNEMNIKENQISTLSFQIEMLKDIIQIQNKRLETLEYITSQGASKDIAQIIIDKSLEYNFDPYLIARLIKAESKFNHKAVNKSSGAMGLMQITPQTARLYKFKLTNEPDENISQGLYILTDKLKEYGSIEKALASYHGGHLRGKYWGTLRIDQGKTLRYVHSIIGGK